MVTASIFLCLSSITLKSLYSFAFGNASTVREAEPEKSTSHKAETFSRPDTEAFIISLAPFPPEPMAARFKRSLGAIYPGPPST